MPPNRQAALKKDLALFGRLPLTEEAALMGAHISSLMREKKHRPHTTDMLIAACALFHKAIVIHKDRDFETIRRFSPLQTISFL